MTTDTAEAARFDVRLDNFEGPFDLLLNLIAKHKLDITEVALSKVTDEFIVHVKAAGAVWDLEQTTSFLVVASTLLDLKAARLLPQGDVEDEEDLALLEARDLLFARLLQYKAFKQVARVLSERLAGEARRHPRAVGLEERFARVLPEVLIGIGLDQFAGHRRQGPGAQAPPGGLAHPHPRHEGVGPRTGCARRGPAPPRRHDDLPGAVRRLSGHPDHRGPVPGPAGAVPGGCGRLRPGHPDG